MSVATTMMLGLLQAKQDLPWKTNIEKYSINLMWINKKLVIGKTYINSSKTIEELKKQLFDPALKWAKANPNATVNIWYDSIHTEQEAIKRTQDALLSMNTHELRNTSVHLRDIREIPIVRDNPHVFSDCLPVYFRVDLLKAIIIVDAIEREGNDAAIFSDLEVGDLRPKKDRMSKEELFSPLPEISARFAKAGLILNINSSYNENQFIQLYNNPAMIFAIKHAVINVNITRAVSALNFKHEKEWMEKVYIQTLSRAVYPSIQQDVFAYYEALSTKCELLVRPDIVGKGSKNDAWLSYNPNEHGYAPFGLYCFSRCFRNFGSVILGENDNIIPVGSVFKLPKVDSYAAPGRKVDVRPGNDHHDFAFNLPLSEIKPKPPTSSDGVYRCKLLECKWVLSAQMTSAQESSFIDKMAVLQHYHTILNNMLTKDCSNLVLEYLSENDTILKWRHEREKLNNSSSLSSASTPMPATVKDGRLLDTPAAATLATAIPRKPNS